MSEFEADDTARHAKPDPGQLVPTDKSFIHSWNLAHPHHETIMTAFSLKLWHKGQRYRGQQEP